MNRIYIFLLLLAGLYTIVQGQQLRGTVKDCKTGEPLAFVNLMSADGRYGAATDIEGRFVMEDVQFPLQLMCSYVGYRADHRWINSGEEAVHIELCPQVLTLTEVIIVPWDNPALALMQKVTARRDAHNPARLSSYSCDAYGKMIFTIDTTLGDEKAAPLPDSTMRKVRKLLEEQHLFLMETVSEREYRKGRLEEKVTGSRISGLKDPLFVFLISQIQSFSFYDEIIRIADKSYLNPASPGGLKKYLYSLEDTIYQGSDTLYVVKYRPRPGVSVDAMQGLLYIHGRDYAIQNVTASPAVEDGGMSIRIRQKYGRIDGHWFPLELGTSLVLKNVIVGRYYAVGEGNYYLKNIRINEEGRPLRGTVGGIEVSLNAHKRDSAFWAEHRVAALETKELRTYQVIDSIGEAQGLDYLTRRLDALMRGQYPLGPLDLDLKKLIRYSEYEGIYGGVGLATNQRLIPWFSLAVNAGYGYGDNKLKYGGSLEVPLYRRMDFRLLASASRDLREEGSIWDPQISGSRQELYLRKLLIQEMDLVDTYQGGFQIRPLRDVLLKAEYIRQAFHFGLREAEWLDIDAFSRPHDLVSLELRYAIGEKMLMNPYQVMSAGTQKPVFWLRLRQGLESPDPAAKAMQSIEMKAWARIRTRSAGMLYINLLGGMQLNAQPAQLRFNGRGSYRPLTLFAANSFATVRMNEFLADHYSYLFLSWDFQHHLTRNRKLPGLRLHLHTGWSELRYRKLIPENARGMDKVLVEAGLDIPDLLNLGLIKLGIGGFYRFGHYAFEKTADNLAWKVVLGLPF